MSTSRVYSRLEPLLAKARQTVALEHLVTSTVVATIHRPEAVVERLQRTAPKEATSPTTPSQEVVEALPSATNASCRCGVVAEVVALSTMVLIKSTASEVAVEPCNSSVERGLSLTGRSMR